MERILRKYREMGLSAEQFGTLVNMMLDYLDSRTAKCEDKNIMVIFFTKTKKDLDKMINERNRKRGYKNGK